MQPSVGKLVFYLLLLLQTACAADTIENRQHGQQMVCHDGHKTLTLSNADSFGHLQHGDSAGPCAAQG